MNKLINYIVTHFKIQKSHPEESDPGWEIRWAFFNIAFLKRKKDESCESTKSEIDTWMHSE